MILDALLLLSSVIATPSHTGIRLFNPHEFAVTATVQCGSASQEVHVEAGDVIDLDGCAGAELLGAPVPLTMIETGIGERGDSQRLRTSGSSCPSLAIEAPLFGCKGGTVIVGVPSVLGSECQWSVDGAVILSGQGTPQAVIQLGDGPSARIGVTVTGSCASTGEAVVAIRNPIVIESFEVPEIATADQETTVRWLYVPGTVPVSQVLMGSALESPVVLDPAARSYTWKPRLSGDRTIELRASLQKAIATRRVKRRAAGSRAGTSECPATRMEKRIEVRGCSALSVSISAPESVEEGSVFKASVELNHGELVHWNVFGGTILEGEDEETVTVQAPEDRDGITLTATVSSSPGCSSTADTSLTVVERAICATSRPSAVLDVETVSCDAVTVKATFTGTPPFRGLWPDGTTFETQSMTLRHDFTNAGTAYSLRSFRDAYCSGTWTPSERVDHFGAGVSVHTVGGTCPGATGIATFTGNPPFTGKWAGGEWFATSQYTLEKPNLAAGETVAIEYLSDATCPRTFANSKSIQIERPPTIRIWDRSVCATDFGPETSILVDVNGGAPPFAIYWSDGVITTGGPSDRLLVRNVRVEQDSTFTIDRVSSRTCDAELPPERTVNVQVRKNARIEGGTSSRVICDKQIGTASLAAGPIPGATIQWSHSNGQILSGQGTHQITYSVNRYPGGTLNVDVTYPDNECTSSQSVWTAWSTQGKISRFEVVPSTISKSGRAKVYVSTDSYIDFWSLGTVPNSRNSGLDIPGSICGSGGCVIDFVDLEGAGTVDFTLFADGPCMDPLEAITRLTIVP